MIDSESNPVEWAALMDELDDAKDHLATLLGEMLAHGIDEEAYQIQLGHVFAHLNRAWNTRNQVGDYNERERAQFSSYPGDLEPRG